ncbi:MAG: SDR family oxidoreductase [Frankiaceae bacterium]
MRVLITGASRGIGLELARQYAEAGHHVVATCRDPSTAVELPALAAAHPRVRIRALDVTDDAMIERVAAELDEPLDLLVNNAVHYGRTSGALHDVDRADWLRMMDVNTIGPLCLTAALRPALRRGTSPRVVGISSVKGSIERNHMGASYPYRSSKAALNAVLRSLALDMAADGIAVYALSPGWVDRGEAVAGDLDFDARLRKARRFRAEFGDPSVRQSLVQAVSRMIELIERLRPDESGEFLDHLGRPLPW